MEFLRGVEMSARLAYAGLVTGDFRPLVLLHLAGQVPDTSGVIINGSTITAPAGTTVGSVLAHLVSEGYISQPGTHQYAQCGADIVLNSPPLHDVSANVLFLQRMFERGVSNMPLPDACLPHPSLWETIYTDALLVTLGVVGVGALYLTFCMMGMVGNRPTYNEAIRARKWAEAAGPTQYAQPPKPEPGPYAGTKWVYAQVDEQGNYEKVMRVVDEGTYRKALREEFKRQVEEAELGARLGEAEIKAAFYRHFQGISGTDVQSYMDYFKLLNSGGGGGEGGWQLPASPQSSEGSGLSEKKPASPSWRRKVGTHIVELIVKGGGKMRDWWMVS